jgi:hypothetical protein
MQRYQYDGCTTVAVPAAASPLGCIRSKHQLLLLLLLLLVVVHHAIYVVNALVLIQLFSLTQLFFSFLLCTCACVCKTP